MQQVSARITTAAGDNRILSSSCDLINVKTVSFLVRLFNILKRGSSSCNDNNTGYICLKTKMDQFLLRVHAMKIRL